MVALNVFRVLGDVSHTLSKCILIWAVHRNKSAEGVSLITQVLYAIVFITRYVNLFSIPLSSWLALWNFVLKIFYILSSGYIVLLMIKVYPRTREREKAWKFGIVCLGGASVLGLILTAIVERKHTTIVRILWSFSEILESVCVLPQLILLRQTNVPTVIDSYYLLTLGAYRAFYILNWIVRHLDPNDHFHRSQLIAVVFGSLQTALYLDFAWVYWTRQRVKLRGGGLVDSDDLRSSWLLRRILGRPMTTAPDNDGLDGDGPTSNHVSARPKTRGRWGARGISISADDDLESPTTKKDDGKVPGDDRRTTSDARHVVFEDDDDDDDDQDHASERDVPDRSRLGQSSMESNGEEAQGNGIAAHRHRRDEDDHDNIIVHGGQAWRAA